MHADGFLESPENREAIAMAIDREGLIAAFGVGGWTPSTRIVSPGIDGDLGTIGERWTALDLAQRRTQASARVARWRAHHDGPLRLRIALPEGPGADVLFTRLKQDLAAIGIEAQRVGADAKTDLRLIDDIARYPQAMWFLNRFNCRVQRGLCNKAADERAAEARVAEDPAARSALLAEAEAELTAANVFIPFGAPIRWSLVRSDAIGFAPNRWGWHPLMPMALRPK
jgi:peptide/nickel transport system substrate-binding protein/oligopeptide transport system substrate-binding protein